VWQCVAVCYSVLQCVAVCCSVLQCFAVCRLVLTYVDVCCRVLYCVAVCEMSHYMPARANKECWSQIEDPQLRSRYLERQGAGLFVINKHFTHHTGRTEHTDRTHYTQTEYLSIEKHACIYVCKSYVYVYT